MAANNAKGVATGGNGAATVHFSLQGKGGVSKSVVASWLAQYFRHKDLVPTCIDTDPINATLTQFKDLSAEHLNVLKAGVINEKQFDLLVEQICRSNGIFVVDTGATTFVPLWNYMLEHQLFQFLVERPTGICSPHRHRGPGDAGYPRGLQADCGNRAPTRALSSGSMRISARSNSMANASRICNWPTSSPLRSPVPS